MPPGRTEVKLMVGNNAPRSKGTAQVGHWEHEGIIRCRKTGWKTASCHNQLFAFQLHLPSHINAV